MQIKAAQRKLEIDNNSLEKAELLQIVKFIFVFAHKVLLSIAFIDVKDQVICKKIIVHFI